MNATNVPAAIIKKVININIPKKMQLKIVNLKRGVVLCKKKKIRTNNQMW